MIGGSMTTIAFLWFAAGCLFVYSAWTDTQTMRIPNWVSLCLIALYGTRFALAPETTDPMTDALLLGGVLAAGFALFALKGMGAGDVKLMAAGALWFGTTGAFSFLTITGLGGGLLALGIRMIQSWPDAQPILLRYLPGFTRNNYVPYALAILAGAVGGLYDQFVAWSLVP
jgi:prepilin peptidase CpaA